MGQGETIEIDEMIEREETIEIVAKIEEVQLEVKNVSL